MLYRSEEHYSHFFQKPLENPARNLGFSNMDAFPYAIGDGSRPMRRENRRNPTMMIQNWLEDIMAISDFYQHSPILNNSADTGAA
jgi:hypothetical protein